MVQHQIHNNPDVSFFRLCNQLFHVRKCSEDRVDILIIGNIVAIIVHRRTVNGRKPDRIDTQFFQIRQSFNNALQISDSIPVAVLKASGINLINYRIFPPVFFHDLLLFDISDASNSCIFSIIFCTAWEYGIFLRHAMITPDLISGYRCFWIRRLFPQYFAAPSIETG